MGASVSASQTQCQAVLVIPCIGGGGCQIAGIPLLAVGCGISELDALAVGKDAALPHAVLESGGAAVQGIGAVVDGKAVFLAVEGELAQGYAVGKTARNLSGTRAVGHIAAGLIVAQDDILELAVASGHPYAHDSRAEAREHGAGAVAVGEDIVFDFGQCGRGIDESCNFHDDYK